jgi:transcriptional regulator with XRE-family HTH domain
MSHKCLELIRTIRREKNYSQEYVANILGITQKAYSEIESGKTALKHDLIKNLAEILEISADRICQINNCSVKSVTEKNQKLIELLELNKIIIPKNLY